MTTELNALWKTDSRRRPDFNYGRTKVLNWKTYSNNTYGYEIKYPPSWTLIAPEPRVAETTIVTEIRKDKDVPSIHNLVIMGNANVTRDMIDSDSIIGANKIPKPDIYRTNIGGGDAQIRQGVSAGKFYTHIVIWYKKTFLEISWTDSAERTEQDNLDLMLSSLRFTSH